MHVVQTASSAVVVLQACPAGKPAPAVVQSAHHNGEKDHMVSNTEQTTPAV